MELTKKESYAIQIENYIKNGEFLMAKGLATEMLKRFPAEVLSYFMAAKADFSCKDYDEAEKKAENALKLSMTKNDRMYCTILLTNALLMQGKNKEAETILQPFKDEQNEEIKRLLFLVAILQSKGEESAKYYTQLHEINRIAAEKIIKEIIWS